jgi:hypothetical protein
MSNGLSATSVRATLDAWRERGADRFDPVRFRIIEAMERRATEHSGETRRVLDAKIVGLVDAYAGNLAANFRPEALDYTPACGPLAGLIEYIGNAYIANAREPNAYPEMAALEYFRETWNTISTERQFKQSLAQVPGNAGPLNSSSLVHRSLSLMRELSPGYLQQFLSYADALSWLEQMNAASGAAADKDAPRNAATKKSSRGKSRSG